MDIGPSELLIVLAIALLLFGGAKLPQLARSLGEAKREFHKGIDEGDTKTAATDTTAKEATAKEAPAKEAKPAADA